MEPCATTCAGAAGRGLGSGGVIINNIITIDVDITFNNGAGTCASHAGADVTSTTAPIPKESLSRDP